MKKILMAAAATTALAIATPAFAQTGSATTNAQATTQATTPPAAQATGAASGALTTPEAQAQGSATGSAATPSTPAPSSATPAPSAAAQPTAPDAAASTTAENTASASTPTRHRRRTASNASSFGASSDVALNAAVPAQVNEVVERGHYTAEDLNRAQLEALRGGATSTPG